MPLSAIFSLVIPVVEIRKCTVSDIVNAPNFAMLIKAYGDECAVSGLPSPETRIPIYYQLEVSGLFDAFGAYEDNDLIGFISMLEYPSAHYGVPLGMSESFFVKKDKRGTGAGAMLRKAIKVRAVERGLKGVLLTAPVNGPLAAVLEQADDCTETHRVFLMGVS